MALADPISPPVLRVAAPKPKMTVYYALLIIALIAMLFACLFLYLEIGRFGGFGAVPGNVSSVERPVLFHHGVLGAHGEQSLELVSVNSVSSVVNS
jgi:hypothetical protein